MILGNHHRTCSSAPIKPHASRGMVITLVLGGWIPPACVNQEESPLDEFKGVFQSEGIQAPMEGHSGYRGANWSPERLAFHQNLETFADRIGLIVGLQANGKIGQDQAFEEIRKLWSQLKASSKELLSDH